MSPRCGLGLPTTGSKAARAIAPSGSIPGGKGQAMSTATAQPSKPARPTAPRLDFIPAELKARTQWVVWKYEFRDRKWTKVPYQPLSPERNAKADVPSTWSSFDEAWKLIQLVDLTASVMSSPGYPLWGRH